VLLQRELGSTDPGRIGAYRLTARLGEGGQGVVYLALGPDGEQVVVKLLRAAALRDPAARARLAREVNAARTVARFCTAQVLAADIDGDPPYVVSEYVPGPTLAQLVRSSGPLSGAALDRLAVGTATALTAIHQARIVHRDVKPGNVVLGPDGPRMIDFGIAHDLAGDVTATAAMLGTPAFTAPEQVTSGAVGPPADLFAWGSTMVFAATGRSPFDAGSAVAQLHRVLHAPPDLTGVPRALAAVVERCLDKEPGLRPTAEQVLLHLLGGVRDGGPGARGGAGPRVRATQEHLRAGDVTTVLAEPEPQPEPDPFGGPFGAHDGAWEDARAGARAGTAARWHDVEEPPRRRPGRAPLALVLGVAAVVLAGVTAWRTAGHGAPSAPQAPAAARATTPSAPASAPAPVVPAGFAGRWSGQVAQPPGAGRTFPVSLTLTGGTAEGGLVLPTLGCTAVVDVAGPPPSDTRLTLDERTTADPRGRCAAAARIVLTAAGDGTLGFSWQDDANPGNTATATLSRT